MDEESSLNSFESENKFALFVGLIVAVVHFGTTVSVLIVENETYSLLQYLSEFIGVVLLAPSITVTTLFADVFQIDLPDPHDFSLFSLIIIAYSSALYGISGRLLASNHKLLRQLGIALISLLVLSKCCVLSLYY